MSSTLRLLTIDGLSRMYLVKACPPGQYMDQKGSSAFTSSWISHFRLERIVRYILGKGKVL